MKISEIIRVLRHVKKHLLQKGKMPPQLGMKKIYPHPI